MIWLAKRIGSTSFELVGGSQPSATIFAEIYQAPAEAEHAADLDVITELDEFGESRKRIVINATKRQARLDAEAQDELDRKATEDAKLADDEAMKLKVKSFSTLTRADKDVLLLKLLAERYKA